MSFAFAEKLPEDSPPLVADQADAALDKLRIGDPLPEGGLYWDWRGDKRSVNVRFAGRALRMYFLDDEGCIMTPPRKEAVVVCFDKLYNLRIKESERHLVPAPGGAFLISSAYDRPARPRLWMRVRFPGWCWFKDEQGRVGVSVGEETLPQRLYKWDG